MIDNRFQQNVSKMNPIVGLLMAVLFFVALFYFAKLVFNVLSFIAPFLIIATFFIRRQVIYDYMGMLGGLIKKSLPMGIVASILSVIGFPFVSGYLFAKAMLYRKVDQMREDVDTPVEGEYVQFEEVEELELPNELELKDLDEIEIKRTDTYDDLFKE